MTATDGAPAARRPWWALPVWGVLLLPWTIVVSGGACKCGHLAAWPTALLLATGALTWAWSLFGLIPLRALVAAVPLWIGVKGVCDVLWDGHKPLLRAAPAFLLVSPRVALLGTVLLVYVATAIAVSRRRAAAAQE
ncbi:MAG: hypothetical protein KF878_02400 [Planctomycetes bacterium]|nr:hypothetical protein [Planctomycetota bacterium]